MLAKRGQIRAEVSIEYWKKFEELRNRTGKSKKELMEMMVIKLHNELFNMQENIDGINTLFNDFEKVLNGKIDTIKNESAKINSSLLTTLEKISYNNLRLSTISKSILFMGKELARIVCTIFHLNVITHSVKEENFKEVKKMSMADSNTFIERMIEVIKLNPDALLDKLTREE